jgi:hypothetical protein
MDFFGVVPNQVLHKRSVKIRRLIHAVGMVMGKLCPNGTVKPLRIAIGPFSAIEDIAPSAKPPWPQNNSPNLKFIVFFPTEASSTALLFNNV